MNIFLDSVYLEFLNQHPSNCLILQKLNCLLKKKFFVVILYFFLNFFIDLINGLLSNFGDLFKLGKNLAVNLFSISSVKFSESIKCTL